MNGRNNRPRYLHQRPECFPNFHFNGLFKVRGRWSQILGGGRQWHDTVARVALRKKLGKEPSIEDLAKFTNRFGPDHYAALAKDLKHDVDEALCKGEEVCPGLFSRS